MKRVLTVTVLTAMLSLAGAGSAAVKVTWMRGFDAPGTPRKYDKVGGMNVVIQDLHRVIAAAHKLGGKVVLGGHSLGGAVVTAYATWSFHGRPGADGLAGLVYIDGGSRRSVTAGQARRELSDLN